MTQKTKTILLLRHGKSDWNMEEFNDQLRKLNNTGIQRTDQVINYIKEINMPIECIISSPALRALETAKMLENKLHLPTIQIEESLYPGSVDSIFNTIVSLEDDINTVMIVAHNPALTYFAQKYMNAEIDNLPTSGLVCCKYFSSSWTEFSMVERKLNFVVFPKMLR